jgi:hypothetical protein
MELDKFRIYSNNSVSKWLGNVTTWVQILVLMCEFFSALPEVSRTDLRCTQRGIHLPLTALSRGVKGRRANRKIWGRYDDSIHLLEHAAVQHRKLRSKLKYFNLLHFRYT